MAVKSHGIPPDRLLEPVDLCGGETLVEVRLQCRELPSVHTNRKLAYIDRDGAIPRPRSRRFEKIGLRERENGRDLRVREDGDENRPADRRDAARSLSRSTSRCLSHPPLHQSRATRRESPSPDRTGQQSVEARHPTSSTWPRPSPPTSEGHRTRRHPSLSRLGVAGLPKAEQAGEVAAPATRPPPPDIVTSRG